MTKYLPLIIFLISIFSLIADVNATIFAANSTGGEKNTFYSNETVYVYGNESVATGSKSVRVYVVSNSDSWTNGTALTPVPSYTTVTTNSTGHMPLAQIWNPDTVTGSYDLVVDANNDGIYNQSIDYVDNETTVGFQILQSPIPTLTFSLGEANPSNHNWNYNNNSQNVMMQLRAVVGSAEDVSLNSMDLIADGSGNDKVGISAARIYVDSNSNGNVDDADSLIAFGKFNVDNGVLSASIQNGYVIKANSTARFVITYSISNNVTNGNTFNFQMISVSAVGLSGRKTIVTGLPLNSSTKTIIGALQSQQQSTTQIICSSYKNQSSCTNANCKWCESENTCKNTDETCAKICRGSLSLTIQQSTLTSTASVSGLSDCDNKTLFIKDGDCNNATIASCNVTGSGCSTNFQNLPAGEYKLYACIDVNSNNIFDSSEQTIQSVIVKQGAEQKTEVTKPTGLNYLILIPIILILIGVAIYFLIFRKRKDEYAKLKEKWKRY